MKAIVEWNKKSKNLSIHNIEGSVKFSQKVILDRVVVSVYLKGLPDGFTVFMCMKKKIEDFDEMNVMECCDKLGGHFNVGERWSLENQSGKKHGVNGHNGDLCNNITAKTEFAFTILKIIKSLFTSKTQGVL